MMIEISEYSPLLKLDLLLQLMVVSYRGKYGPMIYIDFIDLERSPDDSDHDISHLRQKHDSFFLFILPIWQGHMHVPIVTISVEK